MCVCVCVCVCACVHVSVYIWCGDRKQTIESQERFHFLRELVSNIPDHQAEDEGPSGFHNSKEDGGSNSNPGRKGRGRLVCDFCHPRNSVMLESD